MTAAIGVNATNSWNYASGAYGAASGNAATDAKARAANADTSARNSNATSVTLSDEAKAYLEANGGNPELPLATVAANARQFFDQQYADLGITSAVMDGQVAIDMTGQDRATLSAIASNAQGLFSQDEIDAATKTMQVRFDDAVGPYVVIARHTGAYSMPYDAALSYLNSAGADERATTAWKDQYQAVIEGSAAARSAFGKAPDTGNPDDPVRALLDRTSSAGSQPTAATSAADIASRARSMLDAQANTARDNGTELTFDRSRQTGQQVDYTDFDNRTLATMVQNQTGEFSAEETRSAKTELDQRNRASILATLNGPQSGGDARSASLALLQQYAGMSDEEKSVMGYTDAFASRIAQNYRTLTTLQGAATGSSSAMGLLAML